MIRRTSFVGVFYPAISVMAFSYVYIGTDQTEHTAVADSNQLHTQTYTTTFENTALGVSSQAFSCTPTPSCGTATTTYYTRDTRGALISQRSPSGASATLYYLFDGNGSVVGLTDTSGTLVATYAYDPYGNVVSAGGGGTWGFQSGYNEGSGVGLLKFGARYDDPTLGRWTQQDPVAAAWAIRGRPTAMCVRATTRSI